MTILMIALLLLLTAAWAALPLLPAIRELARASDVEPLRMVGRDNADISRFARHFREYIENSLQRLPPEATRGDYFGRLPDGTHFVRVATLPEALSRGAVPDGSHDRVVVLEHATELPGDERFRLELFARATFTGGPAAEYRAVLGDGDLRLGVQSVVWRWMHARGTVTVGDASALYGRASSDTMIRLGRDVGFERMGAPTIIVGDQPPSAPPELAPYSASWEPPEEAERHGDHLRLPTDTEVPEGAVVEGNLVVAGSLRVGRGARIRGSIKTHGEAIVGPGVVVEGSLVSEGAIQTGEQSWIRGPVISEENIALGTRAGVGDPERQTTVSGRTVTLASGAQVSGHIITIAGGHTEM